MSLFKKFSIFDNISEEVKTNIKYFYVFNYCDNSNVLFVTNDEKVFGYGYNNGVLGLGHKNRLRIVTEIPELCQKNINKFINGFGFVFGINRDNNMLYGWGENNKGQLGRGYISDVLYHLKPSKVLWNEQKVIKDISCGNYHTLVLTTDGHLYGWGLNICTNIELENIKEVICVLEPKEIEFFLKNNLEIKSIFCSSNQSFILTIDGSVYSFGSNYYNKLGHEVTPKAEIVFIPKLIQVLRNIQSIGINDKNTYFITNEGFINFCGQISDNNYQKKPELLITDIKFSYLYSKDNKTIAINNENIYELISNKIIIRNESKNIFDYYADNGITYKTIEINELKSELESMKVFDIKRDLKLTEECFRWETILKEDMFDLEIFSQIRNFILNKIKLLENNRTISSNSLEETENQIEIHNKFKSELEPYFENIDIITEKS